MSRNGLLINYEYCTGCHACEVACKQEHGLPTGQFGIKVFQVGPYSYGDDVWEFDFVPALTDQCDLCATRVKMGKLPTCAHHCQALAISYGPEEGLLREAAGLSGKYALFVPKQ